MIIQVAFWTALFVAVVGVGLLNHHTKKRRAALSTADREKADDALEQDIVTW